MNGFISGVLVLSSGRKFVNLPARWRPLRLMANSKQFILLFFIRGAFSRPRFEDYCLIWRSTLKATPEKSAQDKEILDGHGKLEITESPSQVSKCRLFSFLSRRVLIQESQSKNPWQKIIENDQSLSVEASAQSPPCFERFLLLGFVSN